MRRDRCLLNVATLISLTVAAPVGSGCSSSPLEAPAQDPPPLTTPLVSPSTSTLAEVRANVVSYAGDWSVVERWDTADSHTTSVSRVDGVVTERAERDTSAGRYVREVRYTARPALRISVPGPPEFVVDDATGVSLPSGEWVDLSVPLDPPDLASVLFGDPAGDDRFTMFVKGRRLVAATSFFGYQIGLDRYGRIVSVDANDSVRFTVSYDHVEPAVPA
jgi:hypothetical protein